MKYWYSWYADDSQPVNWYYGQKPPFPFQFWCSGCGLDDKVTMCAVIETDGNPFDIVKEHWPEAEERFSFEKDTDWLPGDRFPEPEWWTR